MTLFTNRKTSHLPDPQKQECASPSHGRTLRLRTHAFLAPLILFILTVFSSANGQTPSINIPQLPTVNIPQPQTTPQNRTNNPLAQYEQDKREIQQRNPELYQKLYGELETEPIQYDLPSQSNIPSTEYYRKAASQINNMLNGKEPMSLKKAIFAIESAYLEERLDYQKFNNEIQKLVNIAKLKATQDGYDWRNPQTRNIMLFRAMADTLTVKSPSLEGNITSYPMQYDFDDYMGGEDWTKMFVSKLLASQSGQCHSMPLLYLILCEETNTPANLAFSPSHTYAKFKDQSGNWHNLEMTNGRIVSDAYIIGSGYITAQALKNRIYMEPLTTRQTIAQCMADLGKGYIKKYGYDSFVSQCADTTLKYDPTNIFARQLKSDYQTLRFEYVVNQIGRPHPDILKAQYPKVYQLLEERNQTYQYIDNSGYQEMPAQAYQEWLNAVNKEKEKQEHQGQMLRLTRTLQP